MASFIFGFYHFKRNGITLCQPQVKERLEVHLRTCGWREKKTFTFIEAGHRGQAQSRTFHRKSPICWRGSGIFEGCTINQPANVTHLHSRSIFVTYPRV